MNTIRLQPGKADEWAADRSRKRQSGKTFVLSSANQFRLPPPSDRDETKLNLKSLRDLLATGNAASDAQVAFWDAGSPG